MSQMNFDEFMKAAEPNTEDLDVQKAVVESLAADKAELDEQKKALEQELRVQNETIAQLKAEIAKFASEIKKLEAEKETLKKSIEPTKEQLSMLKAEMTRMGDVLVKNTETPLSSQIALLDRNSELNDRFPGETREQVLEVIKEARDAAEANGRLRRAQLLEGVLVANEPSGALAEKREGLKKLFAENMNILSGPVLEQLDKCGISYKKGEEYLTIPEILQRTY